jgi:hypothetical protein
MPRSSKKRNPIEGAARLSEAFHGRPAETVTEYVEPEHEHATLADFGRLLCLYISTDGETFLKSRKPDHCVRIDYKHTMLGFNEDGTQAFLVGGNQAIDLSEFPWCDPSKESVEIGYIAFVEYETAKFHLEEEDKTPGPYIHPFSEESKGLLPLLCYDTVNRKGAIVGGSYHVDVDMDGKYSAGIRD